MSGNRKTSANGFRAAASTPPRTVTQAERLDILRDRANRQPKPQQQLTPNGTVRAETDKLGEVLKQRRLSRINNRLMVAKYGLERDQAKAFKKHQAKSSFDKSVKPKGHDREK